MDLSFEEKSAWGMLIGLGGLTWWYFPRAFTVAELGGPESAIALVGISVAVVVALVIFEIVFHAVVAGASKSVASDERDRAIEMRADRNAGYFLGFILFAVVGLAITRTIVEHAEAPNGLEMAVFVMLAITVSEMFKIANQIWYYRMGVA